MSSSLEFDGWSAYPKPFDNRRRGENAVLTRNSNCVLGRSNYEKKGNGCVGYTKDSIQPGVPWCITLLDTNAIEDQESGLKVGLTTTVPDEVPSTLPLTKDMKNFFYEIKYSENKDFTKESTNSFVWHMGVNYTLNLFLTTNGELVMYLEGEYLATLATGLPIYKRLWGGVDVMGKYIEVKSEVLVPPDVVEIPSLDEPVEVWPSSMKVSVKVQPETFQEDTTPLALSFSTCTAEACVFPSDFKSKSPIYRISSNRPLTKSKTVEVSAEHNLDVQTEEQANELIFCVADDDKRQNVVSFYPAAGAVFKAGEEHGTVTTAKLGYYNIGTRKFSRIENRCIALCSYILTPKIVHMAVALSISNQAYTQNFRRSLEEEWKSTPINRSWIELSFIDAKALLNYPSALPDWKVSKPSSIEFPKRIVECNAPDDYEMYDYPPRIHLSAEPFSANSRKCDITLAITGLNKVVTFDVVLDVSMQKRRPGKPTMPELLSLDNNAIKIIEETATRFKNIGTILLRDDTGSKVDNISSTSRDPVTNIRDIYIAWLQEDENASWEKLCTCLRTCHLNSLASRIEEYFGISSPKSIAAQVTIPRPSTPPTPSPDSPIELRGRTPSGSHRAGPSAGETVGEINDSCCCHFL